MIVDSDPICVFINTGGTQADPTYLYECPCGITNEITQEQNPFDLLHCWQCKGYSTCEFENQLDEVIRELSGSGFMVAQGRPRKNVRDAIKSGRKKRVMHTFGRGSKRTFRGRP